MITEDELFAEELPFEEPTADMSVTPEGGNLVSLNDLKPKDMPRSIMAVYQRLGGDSWLLKQAQLNPKEFLGMLKSIVPKNINVDLDHEINVSITAPVHKQSDLKLIKDDSVKVIGRGTTS